MPARAPTLLTTLATASALALSGCAGITSPGIASAGAASHVDLDSPALRGFAVASMTDLERDVRIETGSRKRDSEKLTPALFWTGIGLGTLGAVGGIGFGVAGFVTKNQLNDAYYDGSGLTVDEQDKLVSRGETFNTLAISLSALAVLGYTLALVTYGVDWNRCGPLAHNKRKCKELGLAD